jgi:3-methyl-2-oxobutanoate hydroxymethyltransferase
LNSTLNIGRCLFKPALVFFGFFLYSLGLRSSVSQAHYYFRAKECIMKNTVLTFRQAKQDGERIAVLTAYDYSTAKLMDASGINGILVGDSLGMVSLGYKDTLQVTMQDMIHHSRAVSRGVESALLVTDMPFMSYQASVYDAVINAGRLVQEGGAHAVKLEGGAEVAPQIRAIVQASIPVMGHVGLTPQSVNVFGGFKVQGRDEETARKVLQAAKAVEEAGAFAVVLECIPEKLAALITRSISIPTIGIGAGKGCDGQVLVCQDMLGLFSDFKPKFVKRYAELGGLMREAFAAYREEVRQGVFPGPEHAFAIEDEVIEKLY